MFIILTSSQAERGDRKILRLLRHSIPRNDAKRGFTLAEVLITLLIIGVVASLVIPNIINDTRDAELNTALKKIYGELSVATKKIIYDNGGTFVGILANNIDHSGFTNAYAEHLSYTKKCLGDARSEGCWHPTESNGGTWKNLGGTSTSSNSIYAGLLLNNGTMVNFIGWNKDCSYSSGYYTKPIVCGWIIADVNGFKGPNITGKDVFYFNLLANRLEPWGAPDSAYRTCGTSTLGLYCAAVKLMQ